MKSDEKRKQYDRDYYTKHKARIDQRHASYNRERIYRRRYGISVNDFDKMVVAQGGNCALCNQPPTGRRIDVDHYHTTGRVRGLLCRSCNTKLGWLENVGLDKIITYLGGQ